MANLVATKTTTRRRLQKIEDQLDLVVDRVGNALEERLVQLEDPQEKLMSVVEDIIADRELKENSRRQSRHIPPPLSPTVPKFGFLPSKLEGSVRSSLPLEIEVANTITSR